MQNKPNFLDVLMNITSLITVDYKNIANCKLCENEPNTNPIKPNFPKNQDNSVLNFTNLDKILTTNEISF